MGNDTVTKGRGYQETPTIVDGVIYLSILGGAPRSIRRRVGNSKANVRRCS